MWLYEHYSVRVAPVINLCTYIDGQNVFTSTTLKSSTSLEVPINVTHMLSHLLVAKPSAEDLPDSDLSCILEVNLSSLFTHNELLKASRDDLVLQQVAGYIKNGWPRKVAKESFNLNSLSLISSKLLVDYVP